MTLSIAAALTVMRHRESSHRFAASLRLRRDEKNPRPVASPECPRPPSISLDRETDNDMGDRGPIALRYGHLGVATYLPDAQTWEFSRRISRCK